MSKQVERHQLPSEEPKPIRKIVVPPKIIDYLLPNTSLDLLNPYYVAHNLNDDFGTQAQKQNQNEGFEINYRTMMEIRSDHGDLPSRKSSISSIEHENDKTKNYQPQEPNNIVPPLTQIKPQDQEMKKKPWPAESGSQPLEEKTLVKHKEQQGGEPDFNKIIISCNCKKTKCLKSYCECFSSRRQCNPLCKCLSCRNVDLQLPSAKNNEVKTGCSCKKTKCIKKYCECFSMGNPCGEGCRCYDCENS